VQQVGQQAEELTQVLQQPVLAEQQAEVVLPTAVVALMPAEQEPMEPQAMEAQPKAEATQLAQLLALARAAQAQVQLLALPR
jgi:hypothetical protein